VRSLRTCARIRSLTTGTFNQIFKDRITIRLSGAHSVRRETHKCESDRPRNPSTILRGEKPCQRMLRTEFPLDFHNGNMWARASTAGAKAPVLCRHFGARLEAAPFQNGHAQQYGLPLGDNLEMALVLWNSKSQRIESQGRMLFRTRESGRQKIDKRTYVWRFLALKAPFRKTGCCTVPESEPRGRGQFLGVIF
jgi:hypothetical protein